MIRTVQRVQEKKRVFVTEYEMQLILKHCKSSEERFLVLFLADTGCRITEALMCKLEYIDAFKREVLIPTLKKKKQIVELRVIKMSERLREAYIKYWKTLENKRKDNWLFPSKSKTRAGKPITRQTVDFRLKQLQKSARIQEVNLSAHKFRHTFGTRLADKKTPTHVIKDMMGHANVETTYIYMHNTEEWRNLAIESISTDSWLTKLKRRIFGVETIGMMPVTDIDVGVLIGRNDEMKFMAEMASKQQNIIFTGPGGIGKTKLLENYKWGKCIHLQDLKGGNKKTLANILLYLFKGEKAEIMKLMYEDLELEETGLMKKLDRDKEDNLMRIIKDVTQPREYTLIIDDLSRLTKTTALLIEKMKEHFHIVCAARQVKIDYEHTFSNFRFQEIRPFSRGETTAYIDHLTRKYKIHIRDFEILKNHVYQETGGNPQYIKELIQAFESEGDFSAEKILSISHTAGKKVIDLTPVLVLAFCGLMVLRYMGSEMGADSGAFRFIGGSVMIIALFARQFVNLGKRKILKGY